MQGDTGGPRGGEPGVPDVPGHVQDSPDRIPANTPRCQTRHSVRQEHGAEDAVVMSSQCGAKTVIEWRTAAGSAERGR